VCERDLISGVPTWSEAGRDMGRWCVLPREALLHGDGEPPRPFVHRSEEGNQSGTGAEGGRFTDSTEDSGPRKPGNSVEEKTLTTPA